MVVCLWKGVFSGCRRSDGWNGVCLSGGYSKDHCWCWYYPFLWFEGLVLVGLVLTAEWFL